MTTSATAAAVAARVAQDAIDCAMGYNHHIKLGLWLSLLLAVVTSCSLSVKNEYIKGLRRIAESGESWAQNEMGRCYALGDGVQRDAEKAFEWFEKAADNGFPIAQCNLALCYLRGDGTPKDYGKAIQYLQKSANQGYPKAEMDLGLLLMEGIGVVPDRDRAKYWLEKAAGQGIREAMYILGNLYLEDVEKDESKALYWIQRAAYYGLPEAQYHYGCLFREGLLVERNRDKFFRWMIKAQQNGYAPSRYGEWYAGRYLIVLTQKQEPITDKVVLLQALDEKDIDSESKALYQQGFNLLFGGEVGQGNHEAITCLIRATLKGNKSAKVLLSYCYATGSGTLMDPTATALLFVGKGRIKYKDSGGTTTIDFEIFEDGSFDKKINWQKG